MEIQQLSVQNLKECLLSVSNMIHMLGSVLNKKGTCFFLSFPKIAHIHLAKRS